MKKKIPIWICSRAVFPVCVPERLMRAGRTWCAVSWWWGVRAPLYFNLISLCCSGCAADGARRRFHLHTTRPAALIKHLFCEWNFSTHRALLCIKYICRRQWRVQIQLFASFRNLHAHTRWNERNTSDTIYMCSGLFCRRKRIYSCHIKAAAEMRRRVNIKQHIHRTAPVFSPAQFPLLEAHRRSAFISPPRSERDAARDLMCWRNEKEPKRNTRMRRPIRHVFPILSFDLLRCRMRRAKCFRTRVCALLLFRLAKSQSSMKWGNGAQIRFADSIYAGHLNTVLTM